MVEFAATYELILLLAGMGVLALTTLLHRFKDRPLSFPIVALALGFAAFSLPLNLASFDPIKHQSLALHITELGVIISLMGVGLKIDRLPSLQTWSTTWRLLLICMPLTIASAAFFGWWWLGLAPASAVLLGAVLAPTDPVLASDVQIGEPDEPSGDEVNAHEPDALGQPKEDEVRFALTAEAGLNDALAFPFTWLAILILAEGVAPNNWLGQWLLIDIGYRVIIGAAVGWAVGWLIGRILIRLPLQTARDKMSAGMGALAATLLLYSITESLAGYGFLAVFIGALTIRHAERSHRSHTSLHAFSEQSEQLFMTGILIALGGAIADGLFEALTWELTLFALLLLFVLRPLAGMIALLGSKRVPWLDRLIVSFFGIRGIGSLFYLCFALQQGDFENQTALWAVCGLIIVLSIIIHGVTAAPAIQWHKRMKARRLNANP